MRCGQAVGPIDVAIALEHICLQAAQLGLATCWIGSFYPDKVRPIVGIPQNVAIIELMALGYPADKQKEPKREPMEKIVCYENWRLLKASNKKKGFHLSFPRSLPAICLAGRESRSVESV